MFKVIEKKIQWAGKELSFQTGKVARQADGSVIVKYGDSSVLATVVYAKNANSDLDFFPLTVHYQDKFYAVGKIPGGFLKREARPSEREVLISRLIDRPIRPLFDEEFRNEVQIIVSSLSYDGENSTDVIAMIAASCALALSGAPVTGTVGASKVGYINNEYVLNPSKEQLKDSVLDLIVAGTDDGVLMVESEAKELSEEIMVGAVKFAHDGFKDVIKVINELKEEAGKETFAVNLTKEDQYYALKDKITSLAKEDLTKAFAIKEKSQRKDAISACKDQALEKLEQDSDFNEKYFGKIFKVLEKEIVRGNILDNAQRIDGRNLTQIRPIATEIDFIERIHGSALFTRGETQVMSFTTLGSASDEQIIDDLEDNKKQRFMLHYNFPPYSVGETGRIGATGRREIGHGKLAWRAINPLLPSKEDFPYTLRVVSEVTESNGSSSMATVCGASMSLMAAGVPLEKSIAGIAMGLIKEGDKYAVLSDILGDEDYLGDMDFKVAGTKDGITALQMDIKITSITHEIMINALAQAKDGRHHIIGEMEKSISKSRDSVNKHAPLITNMQINVDKIKDVIGSGGKVIKDLISTYDVKIDISDDGVVNIFGNSSESVNDVMARIEDIVAVPEIGKIYSGKVVKVLEFGAFVNFLGNIDGFLHVSEVTPNRDADINDFIKAGDELSVQPVSMEKGKVKLKIVK